MKRRVGLVWLLVLSLIMCFLLPTVSEAKSGSVYVKGYYRKDGTYVRPHYRSAPDGNPYNNWSYPGNVNPYTGEVAAGDPITYLMNYYDRRFSSSGSSSSSRLSLKPESPSPTVLAPDTVAWEFAGNASHHYTRAIERKSPYITSRRLVGRYQNMTSYPIKYGSVSVYTKLSDDQPLLVGSSALIPDVLNPGDVGYYYISTLSSLSSWDNIAVGLTESQTAGVLRAVHFPVADTKATLDNDVFPKLKITGKVTNNDTIKAYWVDVIAVLLDKGGKPLKVEKGYVPGIESGKDATFTITVYSDFEWVQQVQIWAVKDF